MGEIEESNSESVEQSLHEPISTITYEETNQGDILIFEESKPYKLFISDIIY